MIEKNKLFQKMLNEKVKIVYKDGSKPKVLFGILRDIDEQFLAVEMFNGDISMINKSDVIRITVKKGDR